MTHIINYNPNILSINLTKQIKETLYLYCQSDAFIATSIKLNRHYLLKVGSSAWRPGSSSFWAGRFLWGCPLWSQRKCWSTNEAARSQYLGFQGLHPWGTVVGPCLYLPKYIRGPLHSIACHLTSLPSQIGCCSGNELFRGNSAAWKGATILIALFTRSDLSERRSFPACGSLVELKVSRLGLLAS